MAAKPKKTSAAGGVARRDKPATPVKRKAPVKTPPPPKAVPVWLDYAGAKGLKDIVTNLSTVGVAGNFLWTASDEGRTVECLEPAGNGFRLHHQVDLDAIFAGIPGKDTGDEADLESLDVADGHLWLCGSHCRVRHKPEAADLLDARIRDRDSRHLLGTVELAEAGGGTATAGKSLPFAVPDGLRAFLLKSPYLLPFRDLPSKENGIDIEGLAVIGNRVLIGLRGPILDGIAVVAEVSLDPAMRIVGTDPVIHLLGLGGLGVRDLTRAGSDVIVLAGPVGATAGPFRVFRWRPQATGKVKKLTAMFEWTVSEEHPEGICLMKRGGKNGLLVLFDSPDKRRIAGSAGSRYRADWLAL